MKERFARDIIHYFPYPISSVFVKLRTDECIDPGLLRLKYIFSTAEAVTRFLGLIVICECRKFHEQKEMGPPSSLAADFARRFKRPSWESWIHFAKEGLKWLNTNNLAITVSELYDFYFRDYTSESQAADAMNRLLVKRKHLNNEKIRAMHRHEFKALCGETEPLLETILESLEFFLDYELYFSSLIEVNKYRGQAPSFGHLFKRITGNSDVFQGMKKTMEYYMDSKSILLVETDSEKYINLDPLLMYEGVAGKAPDIFFFNGLKKPDTAEYMACNHGGLFLSSEAGNNIFIVYPWPDTRLPEIPVYARGNLNVFPGVADKNVCIVAHPNTIINLFLYA